MISGRFTKTVISLELRMGHAQLIYQRKALFFSLCNGIECLAFKLYRKKSDFKTFFFHFYFFILVFSFNMLLIILKLYKYINNIHLEGTVSQIFY